MHHHDSPFPRPLLVMILLAVGVLMFTGCGEGGRGGGGDADRPDDARLEIVATTGMVADVVRNIGGEHVRVTALMGSGSDPHTFQPDHRDLVAVQGADVIFYNGLLLEGRVQDVLRTMGRQGKPVFALADLVDDPRLPGQRGQRSANAAGGGTEPFDPHIWMDAGLWSLMAEPVAEKLSELDPAHAQDYRRNARAYRERLQRLDDYARQTLATIPADQRVLVTSHDAFGYLGRAYRVEVQGIQGLSTADEAGVRRIEDLVRMISDRRVPAVFVESSVSSKNVRALVEGATNRGHSVSIGGTLYSDAMGPDDTYEGTYIGMIDHNILTISKALGGRPTEGGFREWEKSVRE